MSVDCFAASVDSYPDDHAIVAVDVFRTTTMVCTALAQGRRCFVAATEAGARAQATALLEPVLAGEVGGVLPSGFEIDNSPSELTARGDAGRPLVLVSTSGTPLIRAAGLRHRVYTASLRNYRAVADRVSHHHRSVAVIGAGSRGRFTEEDELGCALVAGLLMDRGFRPRGATERATKRWRNTPVEALAEGPSAAWLRRSGRQADVRFVLDHIDDLVVVPTLDGGEMVSVDTLVAAPDTR